MEGGDGGVVAQAPPEPVPDGVSGWLTGKLFLPDCGVKQARRLAKESHAVLPPDHSSRGEVFRDHSSRHASVKAARLGGSSCPIK